MGWRYENSGDAGDLILDSTILTDLPITKSQTGTAFYQTTRAKCFDLPATDEVWIKFDIYFDGTNRWRAYNGGSNGDTGIASQTSGALSFFTHGGEYRKDFSGICKKNQLQSILLHMKSGASSGVIEAWGDGEKIYTYTGDVNHGEDFADLYLQSDGAGTFFSNVIISNEEIKLGEGYHAFSVDTERVVETDAHLDEIFNSLKVWLPFDKSPTFDLMDNTWTTHGNPTIDDKALQLDGSSYLVMNNLELGGKDFTVDAYVFMDSSSGSGAEIFRIYTSAGFLVILNRVSGTPNNLEFWVNQNATITNWSGYHPTASISSVGKRVHVELVYRYSAKTMTLYIDGVQAAQRTSCPQFKRANFSVAIGDEFVGSIDEFRIFDGLALHTANFVRPSKNYYDFLKHIPREKNFSVDVERRIKKFIEIKIDVERAIMPVINVPFLMGDHFNHYLPYVYVSKTPLKFKLPKKGKVYLHASSTINNRSYATWRAVKIFSDTDAAGTVTGDVYAAFDECESVFLQSTVSPQSILSEFMWKLRNVGGDNLDAAIEHCTGKLFANRNELTDSFLNDLDNSETNLDFLSRYCGVDLSNDDTGAVIGSDAGGGHPKTAESIVPEPIPIEDWIVPERGATKNIYGLTVDFPTNGANGALTDVEKHILAGLNSVWIEQALKLIDKSCMMIFSSRSYPDRISIKFVNETNNSLAYVAVTYIGDWAEKLELRINMYAYSAIDINSEDGALRNSNDLYLDRTLAHELTHAIMAAHIGRYSDLPLFIKEGVAEFIHGIDDERKSQIQSIIQPAQRSMLQSIFSTGGTSGDINVYSAGYLFFRYMIKQTIERGNISASAGRVDNLFISDGAVDYSGDALTDNTRQIFSSDVLRTLIKSVEPAFDVAIFDAIPVEINFDVRRAILARLILFPASSEDFFADEDNPFLRKKLRAKKNILKADNPNPTNTEGLQSFSITLAEQQITDQVKFTGIIPFDIMQQISGQYFDYVYNMRVESVTQQGILYSCDCCSDLDAILYQQLNYNLPATEYSIWYLSKEVIPRQLYPLASKHVKEIASALSLEPVIKFEDFYSTVEVESEKENGATYVELIRDIFGWSSRILTQKINCYIRADKLFVIQRGFEANRIDISKMEHTMPVVHKELLRTYYQRQKFTQTQIRENRRRKVTPVASASQIYSDDNSDSKYDYDNEGLLKKTESTTTTDDGEEVRTVTEYKYTELSSGRKVLVKETTKKYINGTLEETTVTKHTPLKQGQTHYLKSDEDGDIVGESVGQHSGDERVSPYTAWENDDDEYEYYKENCDVTGWLTIDTSFPIQNVISENFTNSPYPIIGMSEEECSSVDTEKGNGRLKKITEDIKKLNRKTKETVTLVVYNCPHIIDFNDKVILDDAEYFLVSNTAETTPRVKNSQLLTLERWY